MMTGVSLCITPAKAQFNTVAVTPTRYKMEVLDMGLDQAEPASESEISVQEVSTGIPVSADMDKKKWMDRYLSVSYPLRYIKVTSPYGYRKDPFTGKSKFHGGLDLRARGDKVMAMMDDVKEHVRDWNDEGCVADYLTRILNKDAFDRSGLIYGLGHAVYTKTDPRCEVFRAYVNHLAAEKGREDELALYANVEKIGKQLLMERQHKSVLSTNIDFYSGFVYEMLGLPKELYTPLFAVARIAGWSAHRMEELSVGGKLIRPRYECVEEHRPYTSMDRR